MNELFALTNDEELTIQLLAIILTPIVLLIIGTVLLAKSKNAGEKASKYRGIAFLLALVAIGMMLSWT